ncbi:hypothetical protein Taro_050615, partial [Colocasia esculenta]|nr:hypothetical protein [Colocasia esculenta]
MEKRGRVREEDMEKRCRHYLRKEEDAGCGDGAAETTCRVGQKKETPDAERGSSAAVPGRKKETSDAERGSAAAVPGRKKEILDADRSSAAAVPGRKKETPYADRRSAI